MKTMIKAGLGAMALAGGLMMTEFNARADVQVSAAVSVSATADFHAPLAPHGTWVTVGTYGRCWRPAGVVVGWRPYCVGHWVWTDCGWYWASDEPWAWACYHYGSWVLDPGFGWVWVPGVEWSPAWVEWRVGGGFVGWAPCAPRGVIIAPPMFAFVAVGHFHDPIHPSTVVINNTRIINQTTRITEVRSEMRNIDGVSRKVVMNQGPSVSMVEKATGKTMAALPVREAISRTPAPRDFKPAAKGATPDSVKPPLPGNKSATSNRGDNKPDKGDRRGGDDGDVSSPDRSGSPDSRPPRSGGSNKGRRGDDGGGGGHGHGRGGGF